MPFLIVFMLRFVSRCLQNFIEGNSEGFKDLTPDLNLYHNCTIILHVLRWADQLNRSKILIAVQLDDVCSSGFLKRCQVWFCQKSATDVIRKCCIPCAYIQDWEGDSSGKGPNKDVIKLSRHQADIQSHGSSNSLVHAVRVDAHAELVSIQLGVNGRTLKWSYLPIHCVLEELGEI